MKQVNPEKKTVCADCLFCDYEPPACIAFDHIRPITQRELYTRPDWCPFLPFPKLVLKLHFQKLFESTHSKGVFMWVNHLFDFLWWFFSVVSVAGSVCGIVVFFWCLRGNIKVEFFDKEDAP